MNVANGLWIPLLKSRGVPTLVNVDGIEWERAKWGRIAKSVFRAGARATARHGSRMVYDSREIARWWRERFGLDGDFIPYGGDVPPQLPIEPGLQHRGYVLVVARLVPENSIPEFLEAVPELARNTDVVIVGTSGYGGEVEERVRASAERNPRVRWLGQVADDNRLLSLWQHAGAYFHGHSVGGTNPALVQAMACGAPIVARDTVYNREVLGDSGLFTALDSASMVATISGLVSDVAKQQALSAAAERRAIELYSWDRVCADYETALRLLLDAKANRR